jgi:hypothetical protein
MDPNKFDDAPFDYPGQAVQICVFGGAPVQVP